MFFLFYMEIFSIEMKNKIKNKGKIGGFPGTFHFLKKLRSGIKRTGWKKWKRNQNPGGHAKGV